MISAKRNRMRDLEAVSRSRLMTDAELQEYQRLVWAAQKFAARLPDRIEAARTKLARLQTDKARLPAQIAATKAKLATLQAMTN
jgi:predicted  nucleic acid-binding Zn-ribbon protein